MSDKYYGTEKVKKVVIKQNLLEEVIKYRLQQIHNEETSSEANENDYLTEPLKIDVKTIQVMVEKLKQAIEEYSVDEFKEAIADSADGKIEVE